MKIIAAFLFWSIAFAANGASLRVYGPGGPAPAMKEAAAAFGRLHGIEVEVVSGPTSQWKPQALTDADIIYSGSESMMSDFIVQLPDIDATTVRPLYLRPSAILVRPGNPKRIRGLRDLLRPGLRVVVVQGSGQSGLWEDVAGRTGDIETVRALRRNIARFEATSADAKGAWQADPTLDAWIIWNIWQVSNPTLADLVEIEPAHRIYRDAGVALTRKGAGIRHAREFVQFLESTKGATIFARWGWMTSATGKGKSAK